MNECGGGFPRPAIEMMECKWKADKKKNPNPHPSTFIPMKPDLSLAEILYEKQQHDLGKKKHLVQDLGEFENKRRALEMGQKMMKFAFHKANQDQTPPPQYQRTLEGELSPTGGISP